MINKSLFECYQGIKKSYYDVSVKPDELFGDNASEKSAEFIDKHLIEGEKKQSLWFPWRGKYIERGKHIHTVSLYLMGLYLHRMLLVKQNYWEQKNFEYMWYLTCLLHDAASCIENTQIRHNASEREKELTFYLGNLDIKYNMYYPIQLKKSMIETRFSEELIKNYFYYRADNSALEHGIIAGYYLFDRLCKDFYKNTAGHDWQSKPIYEKNNLVWSLSDIDRYAKVADAIICHNIWMAGEKESLADPKKYQNYGLSPLIISKDEDRLHYIDYPYHFLLELLDTIEPVKRFHENSDSNIKETLSNITIGICERNSYNECSINIKWTDTLRKDATKDSFQKWIKGILTMKEWLDLETKENREGNGVCIRIRSKCKI